MGPSLWTPCSSLNKCYEPSQSLTDQENQEGETFSDDRIREGETLSQDAGV